MTSLVNQATAACVTGGLSVRSTFAGRLTGYLFRSPSRAPAAILLWKTARVHTLFMRFDVDLYFLDRDLRVLAGALNVPPFRFPRSPRGCRHVLEIPSCSAPRDAIRAGDRLALVSSVP